MDGYNTISLASCAVVMCLLGFSGTCETSHLLTVWQDRTLNVTEGDSANITCHVRVNLTGAGRVRILWFRNGINNTKILNVFQIQEASHVLSLWSVRQSDSGKYICNATLEIPELLTEIGEGTILTVQGRKAAVAHTHKLCLWWILLPAAMFMLITGFIAYCRRKGFAASQMSGDCTVTLGPEIPPSIQGQQNSPKLSVCNTEEAHPSSEDVSKFEIIYATVTIGADPQRGEDKALEGNSSSHENSPSPEETQLIYSEIRNKKK